MSAQAAETLRRERKTYLWGSIVIMLVSTIAIDVIVFIIAFGQVSSSLPMAQKQQRVQQIAAAVLKNPPPVIVLVFLAGSLAILVLNLRFSQLIGRPRIAYRTERPVAGRLFWWVILCLGSLSIISELILLILLARWAGQEIQNLQSNIAPPWPPTTA